MVRVRSLMLCLAALSSTATVTAAERECVVLLHGLARVSDSMAELERKLEEGGFDVVNVSYPSRRYDIDLLAGYAVGRGVRGCRDLQAQRIHFVTHSLGGILVRHYLRERELEILGRVVMLGPPNKGSELADRLQPVPGFGLLGPVGPSLGTDVDSVPNRLGPVDFELGVIAGTTNINPLSLLWMREPNDSVVTVESTRVEGMTAHKILPVFHALMMRNNEVIDNTIQFLRSGAFLPD